LRVPGGSFRFSIVVFSKGRGEGAGNFAISVALMAWVSFSFGILKVPGEAWVELVTA
jgi:hypothetical protein